MISISAFLVFACSLLAGFLLLDVFKSRRGLYSRLVRLSPGALIAERPKLAKRIRNLSKETSELIDFELTELVEMLVASLMAGESLFGSIKRITKISRSHLAGEFSIFLQRLDLGGDFTTELSALCQRLPTDSIREFTNKLSLAIARGTPLANSLTSLAMSLRTKNSAAQLKRAGVNETKMLIPVVLLICPVTVIFALYPSSQFLALGF